MIEKRKRPYSPARAFIRRAVRWIVVCALLVLGWNLCGMSLHITQNRELERLQTWWNANEPVAYRYEVMFVKNGSFDYPYRITVENNQIVLVEKSLFSKSYMATSVSDVDQYRIAALIEFASQYLLNPYHIQITTGWDTLVTTEIQFIDNLPVRIYVLMDMCGRGIFSVYYDPFKDCETYFEILHFEILER